MKTDIPALTGLRGISALWVLAFHLIGFTTEIGLNAPWLETIGSAGYLGVDVFFVLSGFVLAHNYSGLQLSLIEYGSFIWKRLARIYPTHVFMLGLFVLIVFASRSIGVEIMRERATESTDLIRALLLVHAWDSMLSFPWNGPSWSISAEWAAYLVFPLIVPLIKYVRSVTFAAVCVVGLMVLLYVVRTNFMPEAIEVTASRIGCEFIAGVLVHRIFSLGFRMPVYVTHLCVLAMLAANIVDMITGTHKSADYLPIVACALVLGLAANRKSFLTSDAMKHLGRISYAIYLCHVLLIFIAQSAVWYYSVQSQVALFGVLTMLIAVTICFAHWLYVRVEEPSRNLMLRIAVSRKSAVISPSLPTVDGLSSPRIL